MPLPRTIADTKRRTPAADRKAAGDPRAPILAQGAGAAPSGDAALDANRRETIDLMAKVLADLSDRVDGQGATLDDLNNMTAVLLRDFCETSRTSQSQLSGQT